MTTFMVEKMSCGACVKHVTKAVHSVDAAASVVVDLATGKVEVTPTPADTSAIVKAITDAGYPARLGA